MTWLFFLFALETGFYPTSEIPVDDYFRSPIYIQLEPELIILDIIHISGNSRVNMYLDKSLESFCPVSISSAFSLSFEYKNAVIGYRHVCIHPVLAWKPWEPVYLPGHEYNKAYRQIFVEIGNNEYNPDEAEPKPLYFHYDFEAGFCLLDLFINNGKYPWPLYLQAGSELIVSDMIHFMAAARMDLFKYDDGYEIKLEYFSLILDAFFQYENVRIGGRFIYLDPDVPWDIMNLPGSDYENAYFQFYFGIET